MRVKHRRVGQQRFFRIEDRGQLLVGNADRARCLLGLRLGVRRHNRDMKRAYRGADHATMKILMSQQWKGNVRELDNVIEHAMILADGDWITPDDLPRALRPDTPAAAENDNLREALRAYERAHIHGVLSKLDYDKRAAAERLGMSLSSLYRKLEELELGLGPDAEPESGSA